jgi:hypothetical protein
LPAPGKLGRHTDVQARLDRLEALLEKAVTGGHKPPYSSQPESPRDRHPDREHESNLTPSSHSGSIHGAGISSDGHDGTLLLEDGQSQFVSSLHWALLADEVSHTFTLESILHSIELSHVEARNFGHYDIYHGHVIRVLTDAS